MQKIISTFTILFILLNINAQDNIVKISILPLPLGNFQISHERIITKYTSVHYQAGYQIPRSLPGFIQSNFKKFDEDVKYYNINAAVDYRFYLKGGDIPNGRYVAPYIKLNHYGATYKGLYDGYDSRVNFYIRSAGLGAMYGKQWVFRNDLTIEIFAGIGASFFIISGRMTSDDPDFKFFEQKEDIESTLHDISAIEKNLDVTQSDTEIKIKSNTILPSGRIGILFGYNF